MKIKRSFIFIVIFAILGCSSNEDSQPIDNQSLQTVIYLIRHAEKADSSFNPNLSTIGLQRSNNWTIILKDVAFDAIYSTNYNRTIQTAQPTATSNAKQIELYDSENFSLASVIANNKGKKVFIVGHSNTIPELINTYLEETIYPDMLETEFGNLYKISIVDNVVSHEMTVHN